MNRREFLPAAGALAAGAACSFGCSRGARLKKFNISYPTRSAATWPVWIASRGGYFARHGLDPDPVFGVHPAGIASVLSGEAQMTNYGLEQIVAAVVRDPELVMMASTMNRSNFVILARPEISSGAALRGKKIGVGRLGDPVYFYTLDLLRKYGLTARDVQWVATGADASGRAGLVLSGMLDAALVTPPGYFRLEEQGLHVLDDLANYKDIYISTVVTFKKAYVDANPQAAEGAIQAQAEAVQRFYADKAYAVETYKFYDPQQDPAAIARVYDLYAGKDAIDRVPTLPQAAISAAIGRLADEIPAVRSFDFKKAVDNSVVIRLIRDGWFEKLFGPSIRAEQEQKLKGAA